MSKARLSTGDDDHVSTARLMIVGEGDEVLLASGVYVSSSGHLCRLIAGDACLCRQNDGEADTDG